MTDPPDLPDGPFTTQDAQRLGITRHTLRRMVREGVVRRVTASVYVAAALEDTVELRAQALALVLAPHQVVCDRTAAWLYGIDLFTSGDLDVLPEIETCARRGNGPCRRKEVDGHSRDFAGPELDRWLGELREALASPYSNRRRLERGSRR
jgi:hypothetical protein